jgi:hypothetical protein
VFDGRPGPAEHDHRAGREDLGAAAPSTTYPINHALKVLEVAHAYMCKRVGIAGQRV